MTDWTQLEIAALRSAVAKGILRVEYEGRIVQYQSLTEMRSLLREMEGGVADVETGERLYRVYATFSRD